MQPCPRAQWYLYRLIYSIVITFGLYFIFWPSSFWSSDGMSSSPEPIVILGGGIIGFATAYYLATSQGDGRDITIIDNSPILFEGASGQANGILHAYGFDPALTPLANLSYDLH